jgi:hypothetical protein
MLWLYTVSNFALFYLRVSRAHFSLPLTLFSLFGLPLFAGLLRESAEAHEKGTVVWRGREYRTNGAKEPEAASKPK